MSMHVCNEIRICTDCAMLTANGDLPPDSTPERDAAITSGTAQFAHLCLSADREPDFSWRPCGACGTTLGGDRHHAVVLAAGAECSDDCPGPLA